MSPIVSLILGLIVQLPGEVTAVQAAYQTIKADLSAPDVATLDPIFAALNAKTAADVAQFDKDALLALAA